MKPLSCLDKRFVYTKAIDTDIRKGFDRVRAGKTYKPDPRAVEPLPSHVSIFERRRTK